MAKRKKKQNKSNASARTVDVLLSLALVAGLGVGGWQLAAKGIKIDQTTTYYSPEAETTEPLPEENSIVYGNEEYPNTEVHNGSLVLVNNTNACVPVNENVLVSLGIRKLEEENHSFAGVTDNDLLVTAEMADALLSMFDGFYNETYDDNILVVSGFRSEEKQKSLYDQDLEATGLDYSDRVSMPGYSEHQTGLGVDLELVDAEYDGTGIYEWIDEHCAEYGIILRYPENKTTYTGIIFEPWHYRYVGKPHASAIMGRGLCLEEYIDLIKEYPYDGEHLEVIDTDGKIYEIYYYPEDTAYDTTMVPVPGGGLQYTVCGNNVDGFIVTVDTGETAGTPDESAPDAPEDEPEENPDEDQESSDEE